MGWGVAWCDTPPPFPLACLGIVRLAASKAYLNAMYECVKHHKGISFPVEWKDVFLALAQVLGGGREDVVNFFFDLYDLDGSGDVSREEVSGRRNGWMTASVSCLRQAERCD